MVKAMVMVGIQLRGHIFRVKTRSKQTDRPKNKQKKTHQQILLGELEFQVTLPCFRLMTEAKLHLCAVQKY